MSTKTKIKVGLMVAAGAASLATAANAQSSRYGNVYDYESGKNCGQACVPAQQAPASRYGTSTPAPMGAPIYVDCTQVGTCAPKAPVYSQAPVYQPAQPTTVYTQPVPTYSQPTYASTQTTQSYGTSYTQAAPVNCPAGTTAQSDGTCMQTGSSSYSTGSTSSYSTGSSYTTSSEPVNCPAGTTAQPDGTCMQTGSSAYGSTQSYSSPSYSTGSVSSYSSDSYSTGSYATSTNMADCPAGTTAQPDGSCMQGGTSSFAGSSVELYQGDASVSQPAASQSYGYRSDGSYGSNDYLPVRK